VIELLQRVIAPYPLASTVVDAALRAVSSEAKLALEKFVRAVGERRELFYAFLSTCEAVKGFWDSEANFVLLKVADPEGLTDWLADKGIRIRNFSQTPGLEGCIRISIGSENEMAAVTRALQRYADEVAADVTGN